MKERTYDVVVCGGGCAGFCAAVQAARMGAKTLLVEKYGMGGGIMTVMGNPNVGLFHSGTREVIRGIGLEYVNRLAAAGYARIPEYKPDMRHPQLAVDINIVAGASLIDDMLLESGADIFYNSVGADVEREGRRVTALLVSTKEGMIRVKADAFVDATGDGDVAFFAGCEELPGDEVQPGTLRFYFDKGNLSPSVFGAMTEGYRAAYARGEMKYGDMWGHGGDAKIIYNANGDNINHIDSTGSMTAEGNTAYQIAGRKSVKRTMDWIKSIGGEINAVNAAPEVGQRETRRIRCDTVVTAEDYVGGRIFDDAVCFAYYPIDVHFMGAEGRPYLDCRDISRDKLPTVPLSALVPTATDNLLIAGRMVSADREAHSGLRVKAPCMAMGQAAGAAAALVSQKKLANVRDVDFSDLRAALLAEDALLP